MTGYLSRRIGQVYHVFAFSDFSTTIPLLYAMTNYRQVV